MKIMEPVDLSKIKDLPEELQKEIFDFIEFIIAKYEKKKTKGFSFDWVGGLKDLKDKYTSVELQHKALEWR